MPSPFAGMNPYLEQDAVWEDFHLLFVARMREALVPQVRPAYLVKAGEMLFLHEESAEERRRFARADVSVTQGPPAAPAAGSRAAVVEAPAYATIPSGVDVERHRYLEIRDREGRKLVTVIELLSPSNKYQGPDREHYRAKRMQLIHSGVHFVEIDLLRGGPRLPLDDLPPCDYYAMVARAEERPRAAVWPIKLRDPLPTIPIPLRAPDPDAKLDLQALLHQVYDAAGYEDYVYRTEPQPALTTEDKAWAESLRGESHRVR